MRKTVSLRTDSNGVLSHLADDGWFFGGYVGKLDGKRRIYRRLRMELMTLL
jgi:hypothetical protein